MMKIFIAALFGAIITANSAMAMTFSQPERLGGAVRCRKKLLCEFQKFSEGRSTIRGRNG